MRLGRIIVAGLAPLISLSALVMAVAGEPGVSSASNFHPSADSLARLLRSVVHLVAPAAENASVSAPSGRPSPQAVLSFSALVATPFRHSLWMLEKRVAVDLFARLHQRAPLRC